jgi:selenocysteine-specific elongation factor
MLHIIAGTAGHIDHGKTTLVGALTGIDTDRLKEEKERGISIDLGFAHMPVENGVRVALVDVPGHERFVRNMVAGVSGIDLVLLVISAEEGIKPQTQEHFEICRLLGIEKGIVVLTKADLVDEEWLALVGMEVEDFVRGSFLEGAPVIGVSAKSGLGMPELRAAIFRLAGQVKERAGQRLLRLPVDRSFSLKGHGTVVTGTLREGSLALEDEVEIYPLGRRARVRSLQVHGEKAKLARAGQRTAVNLAGIDAAEIRRGCVLGPPGVLEATRVLDAEVELLSSAKAMRDRTPLHFHAGTEEVEGELRLLEDSKKLEPGKPAMVRLVLQQPVLLLPGDRFILRSFSPVLTVAGGTVEQIHLGEGRLRRKGSAAKLWEQKGKSLPQRARQMVEDAPFGLREADLRARLGLGTAEKPDGAGTLLLQTGEGWWVSRARVKELGAEVLAKLRDFHKAKPLEAGLSREAVRSAWLAAAPPGMMEAMLAATPGIVAEGEFLRLASHRVQLAGVEDAAAVAMEGLFRQGGLAVPAVDEVLEKSGLGPTRAKAVLAVLLREGRLVRVGQEMVFHRQALTELRALLVEKKGLRFGVGEFKDWTGISRKYAIPLLEYLDREKLTRRDGEQRLVL